MSADDTRIVEINEILELLVNHVNGRFSFDYEWCCLNKLSINPSKSDYLLITNKQVSIKPQLNIGGNNLSKVECVKYLGVYIDESRSKTSQQNATGQKPFEQNSPDNKPPV